MSGGGGNAFFSFGSSRSGGNRNSSGKSATSSSASNASAHSFSSSSTSSRFPFFSSLSHSHNLSASSSSSASSATVKQQPLSARHLPSRTATTTATVASMSTGKNGLLSKKTIASSPALASFYRNGTGDGSSPFLFNNARHNSLTPRAGSTVEDISLSDLFRLIARMRICVIRRVGSDVDAQISSIIDAASAHSLSNNASKPASTTTMAGPAEDEDFVAAPAVAHFLSVGQQNAGQMLDWVQRKGLPLIFLNGDCIGGLTELKRLDKSGFLRECMCPHEFNLVIIGGGGGAKSGRNELAERAIEEAVQMGKRVALVDLVRTMPMGTDAAAGVDSIDLADTNSKQSCPMKKLSNGIVSGRIAKAAINQAALMRIAIEEAKSNGWTVEEEQGQRVSFWLDWRTVREGIEQKEREERERFETILQQAQIPHLTAQSCQFSGFHELSISSFDPVGMQQCNNNCIPSEQQQRSNEPNAAGVVGDGRLLRLSSDRFLIVTKPELRTLEMVPGAKENCIPIGELFALGYNPGKTLFCCEPRNDGAIEPTVLESAALLRGLDNEVMIMCYTYATNNASKQQSTALVNGITAAAGVGHHRLHQQLVKSQPTTLSHSSPASFDPELIAHIQKGLLQSGVHFVTCVPTRFERLREPITNERAGIVRVYAMGTASYDGPLKRAGTGDWTSFLEEFNTVVLCMGKRVDPFQRLGLETLGIQQGTTATANPQGNNGYPDMLPNIYTMSTGGMEGGNVDGAELDDGTWSGFAARQLLKRMFQGELCSIGPTDLGRTLLVPPNEYSCCGLSEFEAGQKYGIELINVYQDDEVPVLGAIKAKMVCLRPEQDRVIGLHILAPAAHKLLQGYALAMQLGLSRAQMQLMNNNHHHQNQPQNMNTNSIGKQ